MMGWRNKIGSIFWVLCLMLSGQGSALAAMHDDSLLVLEANGATVLQSRQVELEPPASGDALLTFSVGFGTDEVLVPQFFSDSFSLRLSSAQDETEYSLLHLDAGGLSWPSSADRVAVADAGLTQAMLATADPFQAEFQSSWAYSISVPWPNPLSFQAPALSMDLFDNGNGLASVGWVGEIELQGISRATPPRVYAASGVTDQFEPVADFLLDPDTKTIRIPREPARQFYRVRSPIPTAVEAVYLDGEDRVVEFAFLSPTPIVQRMTFSGVRGKAEDIEALGFGFWRASLATIGEAGFIRTELLLGDEVLSVRTRNGEIEILMGRIPIEGASEVNGVYEAILPTAVTAEGLVLPSVPETAFLRVVPSSPWVLGDIQRGADQVVVPLEQKTGRFELMAASSADGPYEVIPEARLDFGANAFRTPAQFKEQFYRLESGRIVDLRTENGMVIIQYE